LAVLSLFFIFFIPEAKKKVKMDYFACQGGYFGFYVFFVIFNKIKKRNSIRKNQIVNSVSWCLKR